MSYTNLDHISSTPLLAEVKATMIEAIQHDYHNPSSQHRRGEEAAAALEAARERVAQLLNADSPKEIVFTSGGTESVNHAVKGAAPSPTRTRAGTSSPPTSSTTPSSAACGG